MADNPNIPDEEEFHFSDVEGSKESGTSPYAQEGDANKGLQPEQIKTYAIMGVGILAVVIGAYSLIIKPLMGDDEPVKSPVAAFDEEEKAATPAQPVLPVTPVVAAEATAQPHSLRKVETMVNQLNVRMQALQKSIRNLDSRVLDLDAKQQKLAQKIGQISSKKYTKKQRYRKKTAKKRVKYYIKAAILGRAWLWAENGSTLTVSKGDKVPGYGTVTYIDPVAGRVMMSSGKEIRFNPDDR